MDKHNVRLVLRPHIGIEASLIAHLRALKPRRSHVNVCVAELLAKGLAHKPPGADVDGDPDPAAEAMDLYVPLVRPVDALVLDALAERPERHRNDWLRARLLAGFAASQRLSTEPNIGVPAALPEPALTLSASPAGTSMIQPTTKDSAPVAVALAPSSSEPIDLDLSEPVVEAPGVFAAQRAAWETTLRARDAANDWAEGERDAHMEAKPTRNEMRALLG